MTVVLILSVMVCAYMAWNIGANDVANAMGTSVGSKALTLRQAVIIAAIFEFCGAFFAGDAVTDTVRKGILTVDFETARAWARGQGFESQKDWWARTSQLPHRIPERPGFYYRGRGWKGYADFLGLEEGSDDGDEPRTDE